MASPDYTSADEGPTTVGGLPAYHRYFTRTRAGHSFYQMQVYIAPGLEVYVISCTLLNDRTRIDRNASRMLKIISTFRVSTQHAMVSGGMEDKTGNERQCGRPSHFDDSVASGMTRTCAILTLVLLNAIVPVPGFAQHRDMV